MRESCCIPRCSSRLCGMYTSAHTCVCICVHAPTHSVSVCGCQTLGFELLMV
jgi:hypothetical protein